MLIIIKGQWYSQVKKNLHMAVQFNRKRIIFTGLDKLHIKILTYLTGLNDQKGIFCCGMP